MEKEGLSILLVEDDPNLGSLLKEYLEAKDFNTTLAVNGKQGYERFREGGYDLCLLDVMMPVKDGFTLAREIRKEDKNIPIIFLTAKSMKEDAIEGFNMGADDYITKPFSMEELQARIKAVLRRSKGQAMLMAEQKEYVVGQYKFNHPKQLLEGFGKQQKLTTREAELMKLLAQHLNDVVDRSYVLKTIWGDDNYFNGRSMDVYIARLRKYLKEDPSIEIVNVHGRGFKLLLNKY
jgi:DNA-binding response OmpR family regulator